MKTPGSLRHHFSFFRCHLPLLIGLLAISSSFAGTFEADTVAERNSLKNKVRASQFLHHATFGPRAADINNLAARMDQIGRDEACEEWIDEQFAKPVRRHTNLMKLMFESDGRTIDQRNGSYRDYAWWHRVLTADDQLRQRVGWALSQIFVINDRGAGFNSNGVDSSGNPRYYGVSKYYDMLLAKAFTNYRDILKGVTVHPIMGVFLSHVLNRKAAGDRLPDENYAREVMQLFSIGLYRLNNQGVILKDANDNPIETYDNSDIETFARVFTGYTYAGVTTDPPRFYRPRNYNQNMVMFQGQHDTDAKSLLQGQTLPAGQSGNADINAAMDNLSNHPNAGPFISRLLIQRLVRSNPTRGYVSRVASAFNDDGTGVRGNMQAVIKAILLDVEAWRGVQLVNVGTTDFLARRGSTERSRLREPVVRYAAFMRAFRVSRDTHPYFYIRPLTDQFGQAAYKSPSVFNFYLPDFQPAGPLLSYSPSVSIPNGFLAAPEFEILDGVTHNSTSNQFRDDLYRGSIRARINGTTRLYPLNTTPESNMLPATVTPGDPKVERLLRELDLRLCHGTMTEETKDIIRDAADQFPTPSREELATAIILCVLTSADCAVGS